MTARARAYAVVKGDSMALHPACHAVETYLVAWFPAGVIEEYDWAERRCWVFKVSVPRHTFRLLVSTRFLDDTGDEEIGRLMHEWHVAARMRMAGAKEWVHVGCDGVTFADAEPSYPRP